MPKGSGEAQYSIAAVSKLTGASCHVLRIWERRYGFPVPERSPSGHRRYSPEQVHALQRICELAHSGQPIGELIAAYRAGRLTLDEPVPGGQGRENEAGVFRFIDFLMAGELNSGEADFQALTAGLSVAEIVNRVIGPSWIETGERWFRRESRVYQERIVSEFLTRKLEIMIESVRSSNVHMSHTIVTGTVQGDRHCGGILMLNLLLEGAGWRVISLGVDLPVGEYRAAVEHWRPSALALSFVLSRNIKKRFQELFQIRGLPIFVGGRSIVNYQRLARNYGLIPVTGSASTAVEQIRLEFDQWARTNRPESSD